MVSALFHDDPQRLGDFRLVARLGSGGMGMVYLARSPGGRTVALKTMHARIAADAEFRTRFRLEIDAARIIGGRHGAGVVDADPLGETPWMATEYVLGPPLDDAVSACGPLPETCVRALGFALCEALEQLHGSDVVHRDLKPSNILLSAFGPKVIDFGIARAMGDDRLTRTGAAAGTPAFMSPEQATGREHTAVGDVFALAGVLTYAATGSGPFGGGQAADLLYRVRYGEPDITGVPEGLRHVLEQCLSKDPTQRPGTAGLRSLLSDGAGRFVDSLPDTVLTDIALRSAQVWEPVPARLPIPPEELPETFPPEGTRAVRPSRRKLLALAGGSALALSAAGLGAWALTTTGAESAADDQDKTSERPANVPPEAAWKQSSAEVRSGSAPRAVGPLVIVFTREGLVGLKAEDGKKSWTVRDIVSGEGTTTDGERLFTVEPRATTLEVVDINLGTGRLGTVVVRSEEFQGLGTMLVTATADSLYLVSRKMEAGTSNVDEGWHLCRFDLDSGRGQWLEPISEPSSVASGEGLVGTVAGDYLIVFHGDTVAVWNARTGEEVWTKQIPAPELDTGERTPSGQFAVTDRHLFVGADEVLALRLQDGKVSWHFGEGRDDMGENFTDGSRRYGPPTVMDGVVYVAEGNRGLIALDAESGKLQWEEKSSGLEPEFSSAPIVGEKYVYTTVDDRRWISAVDKSSHTSAWTFDGPEQGGILRSAIGHAQAERIIVASGNVILAVPRE